MIRHQMLRALIAALSAATLVACGEANGPTSLRTIAPPAQAPKVTVPIVASSVSYPSPTNTTLSNPAIVSVSAGQLTGNVATVPPGATINLSGHWEDQPSLVAPTVLFLAYSSAGLPVVTGVSDVITQQGQAKSFDFAAATTAPSVPGTYYIGVSYVYPGSVPDNTPSLGGLDGTGTPEGGHAFSFQVNVVGPIITPTVTGTLGTNNFYVSDVTVTWSVSDPFETITGKSGCDDKQVAEGSTTLTCVVLTASGIYSKEITINRDATKPTLTPSLNPASANSFGWYKSTVTASWVCTDANSGVTNDGGSLDFSNEGTNQGTTATCTDRAGNTATYTFSGINIDKTGPTVSGSVSPSSVRFGETATATATASDALSGVAGSATCDAVNTSVAGSFFVKCSATDHAGNRTSIDVPYAVTGYAFSGFLSPSGSKLNAVNAGSAVPVTFSLGGNQGIDILAAGSPTSSVITCPVTSDLATTVTTASPSSSGSNLSYDPLTDTYTLVWKTDKSWAKSCRRLTLKFADGIEHTLDFQFTK